MSHEGPLPDEALPIGEVALSPEELGRLAACVFKLREINAEDRKSLEAIGNLFTRKAKQFHSLPYTKDVKHVAASHFNKKVNLGQNTLVYSYG